RIDVRRDNARPDHRTRQPSPVGAVRLRRLGHPPRLLQAPARSLLLRPHAVAISAPPAGPVGTAPARAGGGSPTLEGTAPRPADAPTGPHAQHGTLGRVAVSVQRGRGPRGRGPG